MSDRTTVLVVDVVAGWCIGNGVATVLVLLHPVSMSAALAFRNVVVAGILVGGFVTMVLTGVRDYRRLDPFDRCR
jgi:membrane-associated phospholipid phosphatase